MIERYVSDGLNSDGEYSSDKFTSFLSDEERKRRLKNAYDEDIKEGLVNNQGNFEELIKLVKLKRDFGD